MSDASAPVVVVLAAGAGTRMKSRTPKVLHELLGVPLLGHVLRETSALGPTAQVVVVGHERELVQRYLDESNPQVHTAVQREQRGTGHAVRTALELPELEPHLRGGAPVLVTAGDTPLLTAATLQEMLEVHRRTGAQATVLSARVPDPSGYGRIVRDDEGEVVGIVEDRDASDHERLIDEINSGVYLFEPGALRSGLAEITTDNSQGEEYLTDVLGILRARGGTVAAHTAGDSDDVHGINDRAQLAAAGRIMADRVNAAWMRAGVTIVDPATTWISPLVELAADVHISPNCSLLGHSRVEAGASIGPDTTLIDCTVGEGATVVRSHCDQAGIGAGANVGPFSFLRPGTTLHVDAKVGAFVETKNAVVGEGSKVPHLSYVGDAQIGPGTNIGAATVFVNYDGVGKHRTVVGADVRVGSDSMIVAPVTIGDGAYTAAGSVITEDVPPGALGVGRARQRNIPGWVEVNRAGTASAESASRAASPGSADEGPSPSTGEASED